MDITREQENKNGQLVRAKSSYHTNEAIRLEIVKLLSNKSIGDDFKILDLGAGRGYFTSRLFDMLTSLNLNAKSHLSACDYNLQEYVFSDIPCEFGDFNNGLNYKDESFDIVVFIEVIEHLEDPFKCIREINRILKKGGILFISTPNILSLTSKMQFLFRGTYPLFNYLPLSDNELRGCNQHVNPLSLVYLSFILKRSNFSIKPFTNRHKKGSLFLYYLLYPFLLISKIKINIELKKREKAIYNDNKDIVPYMYSKDILCGATLIIQATKME